MSTCCLCSNLVSDTSGEFWNKPIIESPNFVVLPSLGSLIEGWLLIVPRKHCISMGALPAVLWREMEQLKTRVIVALGRQYGEVCAFEHGPIEANRKVGCGVDHAHLHVVPLNFDLAAAAIPFMPSDAEWVHATWDSCRTAVERGQDYLYIEQPIGNGRIALHLDFGSQILRKAIAKHLGIPEQFRWQDYPHKEVVARTIRVLSGPAGIAV